MKIIFIIVITILCCVGCVGENTGKNMELSQKKFNETFYGHKDKKEAMSVDEAYSLITDVFGSQYNKIEYYDMVKFAPGEVLNDFYAFLVTSEDNSYYVLVDIYNGVTTFVTEEDLNIQK